MECLPIVSVVVPCYNAQEYVGEAIESALAQTYGNTEVIVVDDGSTDASVEVLRGFDGRIRWETGPNRGACAARNRGIELARGRFVQFLDADDLLHPEKLERQVAEIERTEADLVCCLGECEGGRHPMDPMYKRRYDGGDPVLFVLGGVLPTAAPLHRRANLVAVGGFRADLPCAQERDLHLRLACAGLRFHQLPEVLFTVRRTDGSLSSDSVKVLDQHAKILWPAYRTLQERGELTDARARAFAGLLASDARAYLRHGHADRAAAYFADARRMHPDGGLSAAYRGPTRWLLRALGPALTERLVGLKRRLLPA